MQPDNSQLTHDSAFGQFKVGANYWASHAGTNMWKYWQPEVVQDDFRQLAAEGLQVLRVFPLWPDFQPLSLAGSAGWQEVRMGELPLPDTPAGKAGISEEAMARFIWMADEAERTGLKLIVGLITGWMSGRLYVPPAFERINVITDPFALKWQVRFVRYFVQALKDHPAIQAWDLGNECNCMSWHVSRDEAWVWTSSIANTIRLSDPNRKIISGMHSVTVSDYKGTWDMRDQGELTDVLTTHPYPPFTPYCDREPLNAMRNTLHGTAESRLYADISGRPCLCEEMGTLGPMFASQDTAKAFVRTALYSLWAYDCQGMLWWCAYDMDHLENAPYDWQPLERELGYITHDRQVKPMLKEVGAFRHWLDESGLTTLPVRETQAVCLLTEGQDNWAAAFGSFLLARQAGFDIEFQHASQSLKASNLYLVPSVSGNTAMTRRTWFALREAVSSGSTAYISCNNALWSHFSETFGMEVISREEWQAPSSITLDLADGQLVFDSKADRRLNLRSTGATVIGREASGNPVMSSYTYGKGTFHFLNVPIEQRLIETGNTFSNQQLPPFHWVYRHVGKAALDTRRVQKENRAIGLTEHPVSDHEAIIVAINHGTEETATTIKLAEGWKVKQVLRGNSDMTLPETIPANEAIVFSIIKCDLS